MLITLFLFRDIQTVYIVLLVFNSSATPLFVRTKKTGHKSLFFAAGFTESMIKLVLHLDYCIVNFVSPVWSDNHVDIEIIS